MTGTPFLSPQQSTQTKMCQGHVPVFKMKDTSQSDNNLFPTEVQLQLTSNAIVHYMET